MVKASTHYCTTSSLQATLNQLRFGKFMCDLVKGMVTLQALGTRSCANWIYGEQNLGNAAPEHGQLRELLDGTIGKLLHPHRRLGGAQAVITETIVQVARFMQGRSEALKAVTIAIDQWTAKAALPHAAHLSQVFPMLPPTGKERNEAVMFEEKNEKEGKEAAILIMDAVISLAENGSDMVDVTTQKKATIDAFVRAAGLDSTKELENRDVVCELVYYATCGLHEKDNMRGFGRALLHLLIAERASSWGEGGPPENDPFEKYVNLLISLAAGPSDVQDDDDDVQSAETVIHLMSVFNIKLQQVDDRLVGLLVWGLLSGRTRQMLQQADIKTLAAEGLKTTVINWAGEVGDQSATEAAITFVTGAFDWFVSTDSSSTNTDAHKPLELLCTQLVERKALSRSLTLKTKNPFSKREIACNVELSKLLNTLIDISELLLHGEGTDALVQSGIKSVKKGALRILRMGWKSGVAVVGNDEMLPDWSDIRPVLEAMEEVDDILRIAKSRDPYSTLKASVQNVGTDPGAVALRNKWLAAMVLHALTKTSAKAKFEKFNKEDLRTVVEVIMEVKTQNTDQKDLNQNDLDDIQSSLDLLQSIMTEGAKEVDSLLLKLEIGDAARLKIGLAKSRSLLEPVVRDELGIAWADFKLSLITAMASPNGDNAAELQERKRTILACLSTTDDPPDVADDAVIFVNTYSKEKKQVHWARAAMLAKLRKGESRPDNAKTPSMWLVLEIVNDPVRLEMTPSDFAQSVKESKIVAEKRRWTIAQLQPPLEDCLASLANPIDDWGDFARFLLTICHKHQSELEALLAKATKQTPSESSISEEEKKKKMITETETFVSLIRNDERSEIIANVQVGTILPARLLRSHCYDSI